MFKMTIEHNLRTIYKLCVCGYVGRADNYKKHRTRKHKGCRKEAAQKYYCARHNIVMVGSNKQKDKQQWHTTHAQCEAENHSADESALTKLFEAEIKALNTDLTETASAVLSILPSVKESEVIASPTPPTCVDDIVSITETIHRTDASDVEEPPRPQPVQNAQTARTLTESSDSSDDEEPPRPHPLPVQNGQTARSLSDISDHEEPPRPQPLPVQNGNTARPLSESSSDDEEPPRPQPSSGIARQAFVERPLVREHEKLKADMLKMKNEMFAWKAKAECLQKIEANYKKKSEAFNEMEGELDRARLSLRQKDIELSKLIAEGLARNKDGEKKDQEIAQLRQQQEGFKSDNQQLTTKLAKLERSHLSSVSSRLHIPIENNAVVSDLLLFQRGSKELCYRGVKDGLHCLHVTFDHVGRIANLLHEPTPTKCSLKRPPSQLEEPSEKRLS